VSGQRISRQQSLEPRYLVGPMCCTPERAGLQVTFSDWTLAPHLGKDLHDLT
jgi:regulation of enolase protein 1 (concanavalin A-like superfamily)